MAVTPILIVFFLIKPPVLTRNIDHSSSEYTIINELDFNKTSHLLSTNSTGKSLGFILTNFPDIHQWNLTGKPYFNNPTSEVQNMMSFHSGSSIANTSAFYYSKRQRRSVTLLPKLHPKRQSVPTGLNRNRLQAKISRKRTMADDDFWRSQNIAGLNQYGGHIWHGTSGFPKHGIPIFEMPSRNTERRRFRSFPPLRIIHPEFKIRQSGIIRRKTGSYSEGILRNQARQNRRQPNIEGDIVRPKLKLTDIRNTQRSQRILPDTPKPAFRHPSLIFSAVPQFTLNGYVQTAFPELDWSGPVPWPRQGRMQSVLETHYSLFPWGQKRAWTRVETSDPHLTFVETDKQADTEDAGSVANNNRGDVDVPDSCITLTTNADCHFYSCFERRHTCPLQQNFAYNVASRLCRQTEKYVSFFDDKVLTAWNSNKTNPVMDVHQKLRCVIKFLAKNYIRNVKRCQMEALVPTYTSEVLSCAQIEAVSLDILTRKIIPSSVDEISCFSQNMAFCEVMKNPKNVQLMRDIYGGNGYTEYRVFIHFVKLIQRCPLVARASFNELYASRFMTLDD